MLTRDLHFDELDSTYVKDAKRSMSTYTNAWAILHPHIFDVHSPDILPVD